MLIGAITATAVATSTGGAFIATSHRSRRRLRFMAGTELAALVAVAIGIILNELEPFGIEDVGSRFAVIALWSPIATAGAVYCVLTGKGLRRALPVLTLLVAIEAGMLAGLHYETSAVVIGGRFALALTVAALIRRKFLDPDRPAVSLAPPTVVPAGHVRHQYEPGSEADFQRLYTQEALGLTRVAFVILGDSVEAEECVQLAFARAYRQWSSWRPNAPAEYWVQRLAINLALAQRRRGRSFDVKDRLFPKPRTTSNADDKSELFIALRKLPSRQLAVVLLRLNYGYSNGEIAQTLGLNETAVSSRVDAGLDRLRQLLGPHGTQNLE